MNFSLYRGNLHKVPDIPRRWRLDKPSMSLLVFQKALAKRHEALHRIHQDGKDEGDSISDGAQLRREVHVKDSDDYLRREELEASYNDDCVIKHEKECFRKRKREEAEILETVDMQRNDEEMFLDKSTNEAVTERDVSGGFSVIPADTTPKIVDATNVDIMCDNGANMAAEDAKSSKEEGMTDMEMEKLKTPEIPVAKYEESAKSAERDVADNCYYPCNLVKGTSLENWKVEKKAELQEKLKQLQGTKHQLVQILKQVLISEEESKRKVQGFPQYSMMHSTGGLMDLPTDHRLGSDMHMPTDLEEGEFEYMNNHPSPIVASNLGSNFSVANPQQFSATAGRSYSVSHPLNKP